MSEERDILHTDPKGKGMSLSDMVKESQDRNVGTISRAERKKQLAQVLERGRTVDRLTVDLPPSVYGEWVLNDEVEIARMESLGFGIDTEFAKRRRLHSEGDSKSIVGDVIFMTCSREDHEILEEIKQERYKIFHGDKKKKGQKEEADFAGLVQKQIPEVPVIDASSTREVRKSQLEEALSTKK